MKSASGTTAAIVFAGALMQLSSVGYSFDALPNSIYRTDHSLVNALPRTRLDIKAPAIQEITDGTDPVSRAGSWFDAATRQICHGRGMRKTCR